MRTSKPFSLLLPLVGCCIAPQVALALNSEERLPIHIEADRAEINEAEGSPVYRGNVSVDQGTLRITADQIRILTAGNEIVQIVASAAEGSGRLAHYEQKPDPERDPVYADAREIVYEVKEETVQLSGHARLQQTTDTFKGEVLKYHMRDGTVTLAGSTGAGDEAKPGRISISLTPPQNAPAESPRRKPEAPASGAPKTESGP